MTDRNPVKRAAGEWVHAIEKGTMVLLVTFLCGFALLTIVLRNFFSTGWIWGDALLRHVVLWLSLLGAARATAESRHIRVDLLPRLLPAGRRGSVARVCDFFAALVSAVLAYTAWRFVGIERAGGGTAFASIPFWWVESIFPMAFALMAVRFGLRALRPPGHGTDNRLRQRGCAKP
ncbi:MAG: TRAP transporter small permease [Desulfobacterales bacterium]|nr:TRAP transporter small permease [Desulfobacterales bacterium]